MHLKSGFMKAYGFKKDANQGFVDVSILQRKKSPVPFPKYVASMKEGQDTNLLRLLRNG
jgi:hypothetical protein